MIAWHEHKVRCNNMSSQLVMYKNHDGLLQVRGALVGERASSSSLHSVLAGHSVTRLNVSKTSNTKRLALILLPGTVMLLHWAPKFVQQLKGLLNFLIILPEIKWSVLVFLLLFFSIPCCHNLASGQERCCIRSEQVNKSVCM